MCNIAETGELHDRPQLLGLGSYRASATDLGPTGVTTYTSTEAILGSDHLAQQRSLDAICTNAREPYLPSKTDRYVCDMHVYRYVAMGSRNLMRASQSSFCRVGNCAREQLKRGYSYIATLELVKPIAIFFFFFIRK